MSRAGRMGRAERMGVAGLGWAALGLAFGWRGLVAWAGIPTVDFAGDWRPESWAWIGQAARTAWAGVAMDPDPTGGLLWVFAASLILFPIRMLQSPPVLRLLVVLAAYTVIVTGLYGFSALMEHQTHYHLLAVPRVLTVPMALVPLALAQAVTWAPPRSG